MLCSLHWLPICYRIDFKGFLLTFRCLNGLASLLGWTFSRLSSSRRTEVSQSASLQCAKSNTHHSEVTVCLQLLQRKWPSFQDENVNFLAGFIYLLAILPFLVYFVFYTVIVNTLPSSSWLLFQEDGKWHGWQRLLSGLSYVHVATSASRGNFLPPVEKCLMCTQFPA